MLPDCFSKTTICILLKISVKRVLFFAPFDGENLHTFPEEHQQIVIGEFNLEREPSQASIFYEVDAKEKSDF